MRPLRYIAIAMALLAPSITSAEETSPRSLIDDAFFSSPVALAGKGDLRSGAPATLSKGSLDVDVVLAVVAERSRRAAILAVADTIRSAASIAERDYVTDILEAAIRMLEGPIGPDRQQIEALADTILRAALAEALVRSVFPDKSALLDSGWSARIGQLTDLSGHDPGPLRRCLVDLAYWRLAGTAPFATPRGAAPVCPAALSTTRTLLDMLKKDNGSKLILLLNLQAVIQAVPVLGAMSSQIDVSAFLEHYRTLGTGDVVASFKDTEGLKLDAWRHTFDRLIPEITRNGEEARILYATLANFRLYDTLNEVALKELASKAHANVEKFGPTLERFVGQQNADAIKNWITALKDGNMDARLTPPAAFISAVAKDSRLQAASGSMTAALSAINRTDGAIQALQALDVTSIDKLQYGEIQAVRNALSIFETELGNLLGALQGLQVGADQWPSLRLSAKKVAVVQSFLRLVSNIDGEMFKQTTVRQILDTVLALAPGGDPRREIVLELMKPLIEELRTGRPLNSAALVQAVTQIPADRLATAIWGQGADPCKDTGSPSCWTAKVLRAVQSSTDVGPERVTIDGEKLVGSVASLGDDFKRREDGGFFFHLTVGTGELFVLNPPRIVDVTTPTGEDEQQVRSGDSGLSPLISEQIGFGYVTPAFWNDRLTFKTGLFASGLLYRLAMDSAESDAVLVGGFLALDIYEVIEVYAATPTVVLYPQMLDNEVTPRLGFSFGVQVPLGDYLSRL